jgi:nicotinamide-nucleotide amidase
MTAHVLTVGSGPLVDEDPAGLRVARALREEGMPIASRQVVNEDEAALQAALDGTLTAGALVVILAGLGGSGGEIVPRLLARVAGARLGLNARLLSHLGENFARRGQAMPPRLDRIALLPRGAALWFAASGEPGWTLEARGGEIAVLPRESPELGALIDERLRALCRRRLGRRVEVLRILLTVGLSAGDVEDRLGAWLGKGGPVALSSTLSRGDVRVHLLARGASRAAALRDLEPVESAVKAALGEDCYGADGDTLEGVVAKLLLDRGLTVSVAESCTGGLLAQRLTSVPGSSRYFERGLMVYSNRAKLELLGVPAALLEAHGAVSAPVAEAMATGVRRVSGTPWSLAATGIAGPGNGTPSKPVGTVFIAAAGPAGVGVRRCRLTGDRDAVRWQSTQMALDMLRRALLGLAGPPTPPS